MTKYIKDAHGKFAGSIGEGRDVTPTVASHLRELAADAEAGTRTSQDIGTALRYLVSQHPEFHERVTVSRFGQDFTMTTAQREEALDTGVVDLSMDDDGTLTIVTYDEWSDSPRDWDNVSLFTGIDKYLPDEAGLARTENFMADVTDKYGDNVVLIPIYVYDHSGVSFSTGDPIRPGEHVRSGREHGDRWDTSMAGFALVTEDNVRTNYYQANEEEWMQAIERSKSEVETYGQWCNGDVYNARRIDPNGEVFYSCGGFYSIEEAKTHL